MKQRYVGGSAAPSGLHWSRKLPGSGRQLSPCAPASSGHGLIHQGRLREGLWHSHHEQGSCSNQAWQMLLSETQRDQESDASAAARHWSPLHGYQSLTSTQRNADAARDTQQEAEDLLSEREWEEYWHIQTENMYWASASITSLSAGSSI